MKNLCPPNRKNKERTKKIAVERFEGEVDKIVKNILKSEYDHQSAEYFEADDNKDLIKKEEDDTEDNGPGTFNSESSIRKRRDTLKLRL